MLDIANLIAQMTLQEKAGMCSGLTMWHLKGISRLGIPSIMLADGPHGLRKQPGSGDHLGVGDALPATCFPPGVTLASGWDPQLIYRVGQALGAEAQAEDVAVVLGPGANLKRSPLCGRNFEYFSEDPYLAGQMAKAYIQGVQSQGVGACLKHFAVNNQETRRMTVNAVVDERTLQEMYLACFEEAVEKAKPWMVMNAYNRVNGEYAGESRTLLTGILRERWGFSGAVVSDWGAVDDRVAGLCAGMDLEMPASGGVNDQRIVEAVQNGTLEEGVLDACVARILRLVEKAMAGKRVNGKYNMDAHHQIARETAGQCMVLLKNEGELPLRKAGRIGVVGPFAKTPRYQGGGSSHITPTRIDIPLEEMRRAAPQAEIQYAPGFSLASDVLEEEMAAQAVELARKSDVLVVFLGLPDHYESEGYDRLHMDLPPCQNELIEGLAQTGCPIVVVLSNGSPVAMPWIDKANGVLEGYLGGQGGGAAIADLLFGNINPAGKLAETFPAKLSDNPSYIHFPGEGDEVRYQEGVFVGYRYYDKAEREVLFPFGHGLGYTSFVYRDLVLDKAVMPDSDVLGVKVTVTNVGAVGGHEVAQVYVRDAEGRAIRPEKELKAFAKVYLQPGESQTLTFALGKRAFAHYDVRRKDWRVSSGVYEIQVGASSRDIRLKDSVEVHSTVVNNSPLHRNSTLSDVLAHPRGARIGQMLMEGIRARFSGAPQGEQGLNTDFAKWLGDLPLRALALFSGGALTQAQLEGILNEANGPENP